MNRGEPERRLGVYRRAICSVTLSANVSASHVHTVMEGFRPLHEGWLQYRVVCGRARGPHRSVSSMGRPWARFGPKLRVAASQCIFMAHCSRTPRRVRSSVCEAIPYSLANCSVH